MNWGEGISAAISIVGVVFTAGVWFAGVKDLRATVGRHDVDLYHGDSRKPGLTTRMENVEERVETWVRQPRINRL